MIKEETGEGRETELERHESRGRGGSSKCLKRADSRQLSTTLQLARFPDRQISRTMSIGPRKGTSACQVSIVHHRLGVAGKIGTIAM